MSVSPMNEQRLIARRLGSTLGPLVLNVDKPSASVTVQVRDISVLGVGMFADHAFAVGCSLRIEAGPLGTAPSPELSAQVRHVTLQPDGRWLLGCSFSRPLTADDVQKLG